MSKLNRQETDGLRHAYENPRSRHRVEQLLQLPLSCRSNINVYVTETGAELGGYSAGKDRETEQLTSSPSRIL